MIARPIQSSQGPSEKRHHLLSRASSNAKKSTNHQQRMIIKTKNSTNQGAVLTAYNGWGSNSPFVKDSKHKAHTKKGKKKNSKQQNAQIDHLQIQDGAYTREVDEISVGRKTVNKPSENTTIAASLIGNSFNPNNEYNYEIGHRAQTMNNTKRDLSRTSFKNNFPNQHMETMNRNNNIIFEEAEGRNEQSTERNLTDSVHNSNRSHYKQGQREASPDKS